MKINKKNVIIIITIFFLLTITMSNIIYAVDTTGLGDLGGYKGDGGTSTKFDQMANKLISVIQIFGSIISVVALIAMGIKYMYASVEEKANYKKTMLPYVIGAVMVFAISSLLGVVFDVAKDII